MKQNLELRRRSVFSSDFVLVNILSTLGPLGQSKNSVNELLGINKEHLTWHVALLTDGK